MTKLSLTAALLTLAAAQTPAQTSGTPKLPGATLRPRIHYSPQRHWMNDPNGPIFFDGEYHLFYQYDPYAEVPGHISWGHAVSNDLLHWHELGVAIPEGNGEQIFTGSVVVDERNTSGLCEGGKPCMVAIYTANSGAGPTQLETQDLAVSQDRGRTWTKYSGNPVLDRHMANFRDPNVTWNDQTGSWLMTVALPEEHQVLFYTSPDLKHWTELTRFGPADGFKDGQWECPSLLRVPSADGRESMWALKVGINPGALQGGSGEQYFLGSFDGKQFTESTEPGAHRWTDYGKDSYCAIPYNHLPHGAKPTLIAWMDDWQYASQLPTSPWRGQMTLPRELTLVHDAAGLTLAEQPVVAPLRKDRGESVSMQASEHRERGGVSTASPVELELRFDPKSAQSFGVRLYSDAQHWTEIGFDTAGQHVYVDRTHAGPPIAKDFPARTDAPLAATRPLDLHLILDRISLEAFAQDGTLSLTNLLFPKNTSVQVRPFARGHSAEVAITGRLWRLQPTANGAIGN